MMRLFPWGPIPLLRSRTLRTEVVGEGGMEGGKGAAEGQGWDSRKEGDDKNDAIVRRLSLLTTTTMEEEGEGKEGGGGLRRRRKKRRKEGFDMRMADGWR